RPRGGGGRGGGRAGARGRAGRAGGAGRGRPARGQAGGRGCWGGGGGGGGGRGRPQGCPGPQRMAAPVAAVTPGAPPPTRGQRPSPPLRAPTIRGERAGQEEPRLRWISSAASPAESGSSGSSHGRAVGRGHPPSRA